LEKKTVSDNKPHTQREQIEQYVGRVTTLFAGLEDLMEAIIICLISVNANFAQIIIEEGFSSFSRKHKLLKKIVELQFPDSVQLAQFVVDAQKSNKIRKEAAHSYIVSVNPGSSDEHIALGDPMQPMSKVMGPDEMRKNVQVIKETANTALEIANKLCAEKGKALV
jgi:hypothetical protein